MASRKQIEAAKRNIKKAQAAWRKKIEEKKRRKRERREERRKYR